MTVGIYIRVSTQEQAQEGYSIHAQKERLTAYCMAQGWTEFKYYVDEGVSAKDTNRPQLNLLLEHVKGGQINLILVYRLDRFTRSVRDLYNLLETLDKYKCSFKSATEIYDTSTAMGRMFIGLVALLAQWENENLSERVKIALEKKVSDGERVGNVPFGFDLDEHEKLVANQDSLLLKEMIDKTMKGWASNRLATYLNEVNNSRIWRANKVIRLLKNPALYGATRWNDKVFENTHEGIITKREFEKLQDILDNRTPQSFREVQSTYLFQGVLVCHVCQTTLAVNRYFKQYQDGIERQSALYRCNTCYHAGRKRKTIGEQRYLEALLDYMKHVELPTVEIPEEKDVSHIYQEQLKNVERKREKYQRAWASDLMTDDEFSKRMNETKEIYEDLKAKLNEIKAPAQVDAEAFKQIVFTFNQSFRYLTKEEKQQFIHQFIKRIEYKLVPQPPKNKRNKEGKDKVVITHVEFY
jgi:site-specific DNA recombinase